MEFSTFFSIHENNLIPGQFPVTKDIQELKRAQINSTKALVNNANLPYDVIEGACHDKAHIASLLLAHEGIECLKIWNFAPSKFTLISNEKLNLKDVEKSYEVEYHVSILVNTSLGPQVIDPAIFVSGSGNIAEWLALQHCNSSWYTIIDPKWYLFNTLNGLTVGNEKKMQLPHWFPSILTGDFFEYKGACKTDKWMERGLATCEVLRKSEVANYNTLHTNLRDKTHLMSDDNKTLYNQRLNHWHNKFNQYYGT